MKHKHYQHNNQHNSEHQNKHHNHDNDEHDDDYDNNDILDNNNNNSVLLNIPSQPFKVLSYWYNNNYMITRKFDKGKDYSNWCELLLWRYAMFIFESFLTANIIVRFIKSLYKYNIEYAIVTFMLCTLTISWLYLFQIYKQHSKLHFITTILNNIPYYISISEVCVIVLSIIVMYTNNIDYQVV